MDADRDFLDVEENLRQSFRALGALRPNAELRVLPGCELASLGVVFQMFNAAFLTAPVEDALDCGRRAAFAAVHQQTRGLDWSFWVCDGWIPPKLRRAAWRSLERAGLHLSADMPGMVADTLPRASRLPAPRMERVTTEVSRKAFCAVGCACFNVPPAWFSEVFDSRMSERSGFQAWVAWEGDRPVSTAATVVSRGAVGLYNLATMPGFRRRGYGEAVMRHAFCDAQARTGMRRMVLQSTPHGLRMYERLGFRAVTSVRVYVSR